MIKSLKPTRALHFSSFYIKTSSIYHDEYSRNKLFIKFPGRDLGGVLAFLQGFRADAWLALGGLLLSLPAALALAVLLLRLAGLHETEAWGYGANLLVYTAAVAQQVRARMLMGSEM